ncbi:MAG: hypothetical protein AAFQ07_09975, partial [Chloroflexota bacterium]
QCSDGSVLEHTRHTHEPVRDGLYLLRILTQMLDALLLTQSVELLDVRLSNISERLPVQLSLFDDKSPVQDISSVLPTWAMRYRTSNFYRLTLLDDTTQQAPTIERQRVHAG